MRSAIAPRHHGLFQQDRTYHEVRILLLITAVAQRHPAPGLVDGLTKLAKLDFLVRYPLLADRVLERLGDDRLFLHLDAPDAGAAESPMVRHRYGPWDERYYPVVGALLGRGLVSYGPRGRGRLTLRPTDRGRAVAAAAADSATWRTVADRCRTIAEYVGDLTGNQLTQQLHTNLPEITAHDFGESIR